MFRGYGLLGRPGRREMKTVGLTTDLVLVILQALTCVVVLFLDLIFLLSWIFILPAEVDWFIGMGLFSFFATGAFVGDWLLIRVWPAWRQGIDPWIRLRSAKTWGPCLFILLSILIFMYFALWDWWWDYCLRTPDVAFPVPVVEQGSRWVVLGVFIVAIGIIAFLIKPGRYPLGVSIFGSLVTTIANSFCPFIVHIEYRQPIVIYCLWAAWCFAWILGTAALLFRFACKEIPDPYIPEKTAREPVEDDGWREFLRVLGAGGEDIGDHRGV